MDAAARRTLLVCLALLLAGCGGGGGDTPDEQGGEIPPCAGATGPFRVISGVVQYERLVAKTTGIGPETELKPARFVDVEIRAQANGACLARGSSDGNGAYAISVGVEDGTIMQVFVFSRTAHHPTRDYTVHNANPPNTNAHDPNNAFFYVIGNVPGVGSQVVNLNVPYGTGTDRPSIGFGVLDTIVTCVDQVATAVAPTSVAPVHAYTRLGNNAALGASFYRPSANAIAILAGANGNLDGSDTDYFDDAVIAHELGHYVANTLSHSMNRGLSHGGEPLEPPFAFGEGQATGFGNALLGTPLYVDSRTTNNELFFSFSVENAMGPGDPPGIGGELTVAEIIWDLFDSGPLDTDGDNVSTPLSSLYAAMTSMSPSTDAPYIGLFLDRLDVAPGNTVTQGELTALMSAPENQGITYPIPANEVFPTPVTLGGAAQTGTLDSLSGALKNQCRGITTTAWFRLSLGAPATVNIFLDVQPIGGSGDNLNLYVFNNADVLNPVAASTNPGAADEAVSPSLGAGEYIILIEAACAGPGNRANYSLTVN